MKYYKNFEFFFKRTIFRAMTLFFKNSFKSLHDNWQSKRRGTMFVAKTVNLILVEYTKQFFPELLDDIQGEEE